MKESIEKKMKLKNCLKRQNEMNSEQCQQQNCNMKYVINTLPYKAFCRI